VGSKKTKKKKRKKKKGQSIPTKNDISKRIILLLNSQSIDAWIQAYNLIRKWTPEDINTFDLFDEHFDIEKHEIFINDFLYDLDTEIHSHGLDDLNFMARRAEISKWVYTHFSGEGELNLGNFRNYEAESMWEIGKIEEAKKLFEELIETFPNFAYGYITYGDQYWTSDWSYQNGADYDRAEAIYRTALKNEELDYRGDVEDTLDELIKEKNNPKERLKIEKYRLERIQKRKALVK